MSCSACKATQLSTLFFSTLGGGAIGTINVKGGLLFGFGMGATEIIWPGKCDHSYNGYDSYFPPPFNPGSDPHPLWPGSYDDWLDGFRKKYHDTPQSQVLVDPLILDLNRDGQLNLSNATFFDFNANGFHELASWIDETDAFLVLDKNYDGVINNGSEMFGDAMVLPDGTPMPTTTLTVLFA